MTDVTLKMKPQDFSIQALSTIKARLRMLARMAHRVWDIPENAL